VITLISLLEGTIVKKEIDYLVLSVNGIGFKVHMTPGETLKTNENNEIRIYTHMHVREDAVALYGFLSDHTLDFFKKLISVSGLGPKAALNIINSSAIENIVNAIINEDKEYLKKLPGIGVKSAAKIILELKDKMPEKEDMINNQKSIVDNFENNNVRDAINALISLGYNSKEANNWVKKAVSNLNDTADINSIISYVLKNLVNNE
jgi:Holliday junction DNA helicase RuvA